ncbi:MAG: T9SS type A sorting domain-containing protein [Flavobacteriales bacterium]|nr:T9SS type A sorting domain-containing protein [Flavobacteriales bacterium]
MKKLLLISCLFAALPTFSQDYEDIGWYSYGFSLSDAWGFDVDYFRSHIFPDSTVQVDYSSGMGYVWMHGLGQVLDPTSDWFDDGISTTFQENEPYYVDSMRVWYRYFRPQDDLADTLLLQFFTEADAEDFYENPWEGQAQYEGRSYARFAYDSPLLRSPSATLEIDEILDNEDVFDGITSKAYHIGMAIEPGEVIGMSATYLPANPYNVNDTLDNYIDPLPVNAINDFVMYYFYDNEHVYEQGVYNHGIIARASARYYDNSNGWGQQYWPGIASGGGLYHADVDFYLSKGTFIREIDGKLALLSAFPNPVQDRLNVQFELQANDQLTFDLHDAMGQLVFSEQWGNLGSGKHQRSMEISMLKPGMYTYSVSTATDQLVGTVIKL